LTENEKQSHKMLEKYFKNIKNVWFQILFLIFYMENSFIILIAFISIFMFYQVIIYFHLFNKKTYKSKNGINEILGES